MRRNGIIMLNYLWAGMIILGVIYGAFTGNLAAVGDAAIESAKEAISLCITMMGVMSFWVGIMKIAENAGIITAATEKMRPVLKFLFPRIPKGHIANTYIATNMIANILGLGWAATPAGLKAMEELEKIKENRSEKKEFASNEMCTFLIINISSLQLIPVNVIAYRSQYGSVNPTAVIGPAILATTISTLAGVIFCKVMDRK